MSRSSRGNTDNDDSASTGVDTRHSIPHVDDSPASGPEVLSTQQVGEYVPGDTGQPPALVPPEERATQLFLQNFQRRIEASSADNQHQIDALRTRETVVFICFIGTGILCLLVIVAGIALMTLNLMTFGVIAEFAGIISGVASAGFRQAAQSTNERSKKLADRELADSNVLNAIGVTLMIPDAGERSAAMVDLAGRLAEMVGPRTSAAKPPARTTTHELGPAGRRERDGGLGSTGGRPGL